VALVARRRLGGGASDQAADAWRFIASDVALDLELPPQGQSKTWSYFLFAGPKEPQVLAAEIAGLRGARQARPRLLQHGIATVLLWVLGFFHRLTGNWASRSSLLTGVGARAPVPDQSPSQTSMARYQKKMKRVPTADRRAQEALRRRSGDSCAPSRAR
jgi:hypothetical protein